MTNNKCKMYKCSSHAKKFLGKEKKNITKKTFFVMNSFSFFLQLLSVCEENITISFECVILFGKRCRACVSVIFVLVCFTFVLLYLSKVSHFSFGLSLFSNFRKLLKCFGNLARERQRKQYVYNWKKYNS